MESLSERALTDPDGVASLVVGEYTVVIGDIFVLLSELGAEPIAEDELDTRSRNLIRRLNCKTWAQLASRTVGDIWSVPNVGRLTVLRILTAAARRNFEEATPFSGAFTPSASTEAIALQTAPTRGSTEETSNVRARYGIERLDQAVVALAAWAVRERGASRLADLLVLSSDLGRVPDEVTAAYARLSDFPLSDYIGDAGAALPANLLQQLIDAIGPRSDFVVERHFRVGVRPTLEELGQRVGLTRERVRQLESKALKAAKEAIRAPRFAPLRWRAFDLREVLGVALIESSEPANDALAWATRDLEDPASCEGTSMMLWLAGPFHREGDWLVRSDHSLADLSRAFEAAASGALLITSDEAGKILESLGMSRQMRAEFMLTLRGWRPLDEDTHVRWTGAVGDKANTVLRLVGRPMTVEEINSHIGEGHAPTSLRNALAIDDRFVRLDRASNFGLREWGLEEYSGIAQEIIERIERAGGRVDLEYTVSELVEQFGVSASSVRMYAGSPAFLLVGGQLAMRPQDIPYIADNRVERVRGLYALPDGRVIVHDIVDKDVLRGSGRQFPEAAAAAMGLRPGGRMEFALAADARVVVTWPATSVMGPTLGSVRQVAEKLGLVEGEQFRVTFDPSTLSCSAAVVDTMSIEQLTGVPVRIGHEMEDLARAVGVQPVVLRSTLQARGDDSVLELLPPTVTSADLGEVISAFGDLLAD